MDWELKQTLRNASISTTICLIGCSIGTMGVTQFLTNYPWLFVLLISFFTGLITCIAFMAVWLLLFQKMKFIPALKSSFKMSVVSMVIMILAENIIILFIAPPLLSHLTHTSSTYNLVTMVIAMLVGFLFSLPYNYYYIQRTGEICH